MIVLIIGDFGVGKDTVADLLVKESLRRHDCVKFQKVISYTTRKPRFEGEETHLFCSKEIFNGFDDLVAQSRIENDYYGARKTQFHKNKVNLYCVDRKGANDIIKSSIDDYLIVEVIRPKWLINLPSYRLNRVRYKNPVKLFDDIDYRIMNDGDMQKLEASVLECFHFIIKEMKKNL